MALAEPVPSLTVSLQSQLGGGIEPRASRICRLHGSAEAPDMLLAPSGPAAASLSNCDLRMLQALRWRAVPPAGFFDDVVAGFLLWRTLFERSTQHRDA